VCYCTEAHSREGSRSKSTEVATMSSVGTTLHALGEVLVARDARRGGYNPRLFRVLPLRRVSLLVNLEY
jgi:hypothetical protein